MGLSKTKQELKLIDSNGDAHILKLSHGRVLGRSLLDIAVDNSVDLPHSCGGMGTCGTCRVKLTIESGVIPERNEIETEMANERGFAADERLSCQVEIPANDFKWTAQSLGSLDQE